MEVKRLSEKNWPVILLIENDDNDVFIFRRALATAGWCGDVRIVGSATEARAYFENVQSFRDTSYHRRPQLIVSDSRLTGGTAMDFLDWLRGQRFGPPIPIVILSGHLGENPAQRLALLGACAFIAKTGNAATLAASLKPFLP
jgi:CheY-like chemotaxis protein